MVLPVKPYSIKLSHLAMSPSGVGAHQRTISIVSQIRSVGLQKVRVLHEEFSYNSPGNNITCQVIENKMCTCRRSVMGIPFSVPLSISQGLLLRTPAFSLFCAKANPGPSTDIKSDVRCSETPVFLERSGISSPSWVLSPFLYPPLPPS